MSIYIVYLTYCKICDRLLGYKDTDLASLSAPWQNSPYKNQHTEQQQKHVEHQDATDI